MFKRKNALAAAVRSPVFKPRVVKARKGKGSYSRKRRNRGQFICPRSHWGDAQCLRMAVTIEP